MDDLHTALTEGDLLEEGGAKGSRQKSAGESGMDLSNMHNFFVPVCFCAC